MTYPSVDRGGEVGLIDGDGVVWSSKFNQGLMRWDPKQALSGINGAPAGSGLHVGPLVNGTKWAGNNDLSSLGLCLDSSGFVWNTIYQNDGVIRQFASNGTHRNTFSTGGFGPRGCVVNRGTGDVWIANSGTTSNTVGRITRDGSSLGTVMVGSTPFGVAIDSLGKIWVCNKFSNNVMRIDPTLNNGVGGVDKRITLSSSARPSTLSDMTGSTLTGRPSTGTWTVTHDSTVVGQKWGYVTWTASTPSDSKLTVQACSSTDGSTYSVWQSVSNFVDMTVLDGRYLKVRITFSRATTGETPTLYDVSISPSL